MSVGAGSASAETNCLAMITPITARAAAILGYSVKAVRGEDTHNCNFVHYPIKIVDLNNSRAPVHPTIGISVQTRPRSTFTTIVTQERRYGRFTALKGLGPLATLIRSPVTGDNGLVILLYVRGTYLSLHISNGATPVTIARAVRLARSTAALI